MIQIKKTILTLVALLAVTTGAWADKETIATNLSQSSYTGTNITISVTDAGDEGGCQLNGPDGMTISTGNGDVITRMVLTIGWFSNQAGNVTASPGTCSVSGSGNGSTYVTITDINASSVTIGTASSVFVQISQVQVTYESAPAPSASSGPEVAWDEAEKTGTFTMPGGNVTLEPEYYPQATVADGGVTAADADARATTDDPLVKVDATKLTGAKKLMYFVSNSGTTAPAYDAEGWTDQLPTAEGFTQQGIVYVWYYPVGTDEGVDGATATYSDGDICLQSITARIAAEPTYTVTFAEGTDPNEWTADPAANVKKGQTVTVTYSGQRKVMGVKAEKKAAEKTITIGEQNYTVQKGETWKQFITRNQLSGWSVKPYTDATWCVRKEGSTMYTLFVSSDGINWEPLELTSEDAPIDTDKQYTLAI